jgi:hypothetical protein
MILVLHIKELMSMNKNIKGQQKKIGFWAWIHQNRIKIAGFLFIVILPVAFVIAVYVGAYANNNKVHFDAEVTAQTNYVRSFLDTDELEAITLSIDWTELKNPSETTDPVGYTGGYYKFSAYYTAKEGYNVGNVSITPVLQTKWTDMRSMIAQQSLSTSVRSFQIDFNFDLPTRPLWFVNVTDPVLYLKVDYTYQTPTGQINKTEYVSIDLSSLSPDRVIPNT